MGKHCAQDGVHQWARIYSVGLDVVSVVHVNVTFPIG